ncbi:MAG: hypothetical protein AABO57_13545 [Acidobacteriota bacterium]
MPNDPGLAADTCIFMEALPGDGGAHNSTDTWWLSPDISLSGPSGPNISVAVKLHRKAAGSGCTTPFAESVTAELWVAGPSLAMAPNNRASAREIQSIGTPFPAEGATATQVMVVNQSLGFNRADPHSPGDLCMVARCYPDPLTPSAQNFFAPGDPHVAQHNLCVVASGGGIVVSPPVPPGTQSSQVATVNPDPVNSQEVTLRAVVDLKPNSFVQKVVSARLQGAHGSNRLTTAPPRSFKFVLPDFPNAEVTDRSRPGLLSAILARQQSYEAKIKLGAGQFTEFTFTATLSGAQTGDAYIFHLRQIGADNRDQGGLTLLMVAA